MTIAEARLRREWSGGLSQAHRRYPEDRYSKTEDMYWRL